MMTALLILLVVATLPFLIEARRPRPDRARAPGNFADLPQGKTHYRWSGPETGPVAVCIHGLSTPSYVFAATERSLVSLGYRVLSYDLYGRGYSEHPGAPQTARFFNKQLRALLDDQGVDQPVTLVGYSMGGAISASFAAARKGGVTALVLIAPAGLMPVHQGWKAAIWTLPFIGDWTTRAFGGLALRRQLIEHRTTATVIPDLEDRQANATRMRGFLPAILSSRRHFLDQGRYDDHRAIAEADIPVLAIWGSDDPVIPLAAMGRLAELNPDAHHAQVPGAGHVVLQTHPAQVADALSKFFRGRR